MADQGAEGLLSQFLRRRRVLAVLPFLRGRVLDYGCGSGVLAGCVDAQLYCGVDIDHDVIAVARKDYPEHSFQVAELPRGRQFETIVSLAVIEHVEDPAGFLAGALKLLAPGGSIILTTPHPSFAGVHAFGARIGLFSRAASEEHQELLDGRAMRRLAIETGLSITSYRRFLLGANQLFVLHATEDVVNAGAGSRSALEADC